MSREFTQNESRVLTSGGVLKIPGRDNRRSSVPNQVPTYCDLMECDAVRRASRCDQPCVWQRNVEEKVLTICSLQRAVSTVMYIFRMMTPAKKKISPGRFIYFHM